MYTPEQVNNLINELQEARTKIEELEKELKNQPKVTISYRLNGPTFVRISQNNQLLVEGFINKDLIEKPLGKL